MVDVTLCKKSVSFTDKDGKEKRGANFYVKVGTTYIPIEVVFFPNDKCEGRDPAYASRCAVLEAICETVPDSRKTKAENQAGAKSPAGSVPGGSNV